MVFADRTVRLADKPVLPGRSHHQNPAVGTYRDHRLEKIQLPQHIYPICRTRVLPGTTDFRNAGNVVNLPRPDGFDQPGHRLRVQEIAGQDVILGQGQFTSQICPHNTSKDLSVAGLGQQPAKMPTDKPSQPGN